MYCPFGLYRRRSPGLRVDLRLPMECHRYCCLRMSSSPSPWPTGTTWALECSPVVPLSQFGTNLPILRQFLLHICFIVKAMDYTNDLLWESIAFHYLANWPSMDAIKSFRKSMKLTSSLASSAVTFSIICRSANFDRSRTFLVWIPPVVVHLPLSLLCPE